MLSGHLCAARHRMQFGLLRFATGLKRRLGAALDTAGNQEIGRLYFYYSRRNLASLGESRSEVAERKRGVSKIMANVVTNNNIQCPLCGSSAHTLEYTRSHVGKTWGIALCDECGLYFTWPLPAEENLIEFYSGDYHQEIRGDADAEFALEKNTGAMLPCSKGIWKQAMCLI